MTKSDGHGNVGLLARLVTVGAVPQPEVAATRSLCYLLEFPALADAFTGLIQSQADVPTSASDGVASWRCEHLFTRMESFSDQSAKSPERARVDLVGFDSAERPRVVIEAKFGAALTDDQVRAYATWQYEALSATEQPGVLALLVPTVRARDARRLLDQLVDAGGWRARLHPVVLTWRPTLMRLQEASGSGPARAQLDELLAMDALIEGVDVGPFRDAVAERDTRRDDLKKIFEAVGQWRLDAGERILPSQSRDQVFELFRYRTLATRTDLAIGLPKIGLLPQASLWARFHRHTPHFAAVQRVLQERGLRVTALGGHAWIPLQVPPHLPGAEIIPAVVEQVRDIEDIAIGAVSGAPTSGGNGTDGAAEP